MPIELYVQEPGTTLAKEGERVIVRREGQIVAEIPFAAIGHIRLGGSGVHVSTPLLHACLDADLPVSFLSSRGHVRGQLVAAGGNGAALRQAQYAATLDAARCLPIARAIVAGKLRNQRFMLRRHGLDHRDALRPLLAGLAEAQERAALSPSLAVLQGVEGAGARAYFAGLGLLLPACATFRVRSRRPPRDLGNALLSYGYAVLLTECMLAVRACGLDPALGVLHQPHHDQPALALDLMEEFRPILVDAAVLDLTVRRRITAADGTAAEDGIALSSAARAVLVEALEERLRTTRTLPGQIEPLSLRALVQRQARALRDALLGRSPAFTPLPLP
ncbi:MAG TPA: CRISPR-associated endonuclease Cas1 [Chloroflexota bacterium]|nr:CRISPR-associated endonuclease Cas1 [Chloroflexota bacterium]